MSLFMIFEDELKRLNNPSYHKIYITNSGRSPEKRVFLAMVALSRTDEECLRTIARVIEEQRIGWMQHIY